MSDYIPRDQDGRFLWASTFYNYLSDNPAALGCTPAEVTALTSTWTPYSAAHADLGPKENAYHAAVATLSETDARLIADLRTLIARIQTDPAVTDETRLAAGLPVRRKTRSRAAIPDTRPLAEIEVSQRLRHLIHFRNQGSTSKGKPPGVRACEIWYVLGPSATLADARYLTTATASPCLHTYNPADAGKSAHYFLRWVNTRNQPGPWSETATATIGG
jgi:hypothetical protein